MQKKKVIRPMLACSRNVTLDDLQSLQIKFSKQDKDLYQFNWWLTNGYPRATISKGIKKYAHHVVMERILDRPMNKGEMVDHKKHDKLDCRRSKLRLTDRIGNAQNRNPINHPTRGIHKQNRGGWQARVVVKGKTICLGTYPTVEWALKAAKQKRKELGFLE